MMAKIRVNIERLNHKTDEFVMMFRDVVLTFDGIEICNRTLEKAFQEQHPRLHKRIPTWTDKRGFSFREAINIEVLDYGR